MDFATPGYCSWKSYLQSELDMPGEFVESRIKHYKMRREVYAKGGGGEIHIGIDPDTKLSVAIKRGYSKQRATYGVNVTLIREIRILQELSLYNHPNIVKLIEVFPHDGDLYLVEPFYPSYIQQYLTANATPFNEEQIKYIVFSAAKALLFLKRCHIIHGDVKPANLLVSRQNTICLTDFGSAIDCGGSTSYSVKQSCISTVYYNAPEILLGLPEITCSVDVWSLALTWLRLLGVQISPSVLFVCRVDSQNPTEIQMCQSIFEFLGESPNSDSWPALRHVQFVPAVTLESLAPLQERLRQQISPELVSDEGLSVLCGMLKLDPARRLSIEAICEHPYFQSTIYDAVLRGEFEGKQYFPALSKLRKNVVVPPLLEDFFGNKKQFEESTLMEEENSEEEPVAPKRILRFEGSPMKGGSPMKSGREGVFFW
ncbi:hypothetical protein WA556_006509 [Blastocystis sp. ATCC 50177/Nand II]